MVIKPKWTLLAPFWLLAASCSKPPPTPQLPTHPTVATERVLLTDELGASDLRDIVRALNDRGQLRSLGPWVKGLENSELEALGGVLNRRVFRRALDADGIVGFLDKRASEKTFSKLNQDLQKSPDQQPDLSSLARTLLQSPHFLDIAERSVGFLSPELDSSLETLELEVDRAWGAGCEQPCPTPTLPKESIAVADMNRFLNTRGLKERWIALCDSLTDSWPMIGLFHALRKVSADHDGLAFTGMGDGFTSLITTPRNAVQGPTPTQYDSLMDLILAMEGPSNGLFETVRDKLERNRGLIREIGSLVQPNVPGRLLPYVPVIAGTVHRLLIAQLLGKTNGVFPRESWLALTEEPTEAAHQKALGDFFVAARTAHETITGQPRESWASDYLTFNLPIYLNNYTLARWVALVAKHNKAAWEKVDANEFTNAVLDTPVTVPEFELVYADFDEAGAAVFNQALMQELTDFELGEFSSALVAHPPTGMGDFFYTIPAMENLPLREALREAMLALDAVRGYADGSALVRTGIEKLIQRQNGGKSLLENMETDNLLLAAHRTLASMPADSEGPLQAMLLEGVGIDRLSPEVRNFLLEFYEEAPPLKERFSRILDSVGSLASLSKQRDTPGIGPMQLYSAVVKEVGPREWDALGNAWLFLASSGLFSMDADEAGNLIPRFPSVQKWFSGGNAAGLLNLTAKIEPDRHRALAVAFHDLLKSSEKHLAGEAVWEFMREAVSKNPDGIEALLQRWNRGGMRGLRGNLTQDERRWIVDFVQSGDLRTVWELFSAKSGGAQGLLQELRRLEQDGTLRSTFRMVGLVRDDRMRAIGRVLQKLEASGELSALLDLVERWNTSSSPQT